MQHAWPPQLLEALHAGFHHQLLPFSDAQELPYVASSMAMPAGQLAAQEA